MALTLSELEFIAINLDLILKNEYIYLVSVTPKRDSSKTFVSQCINDDVNRLHAVHYCSIYSMTLMTVDNYVAMLYNSLMAITVSVLLSRWLTL